MSLWNTVQLLQWAAFAVGVTFGIVGLRLPWKQAVLAGLLALPAPLFQVSPGAAGFIYAADLVGLVALGALLHLGLGNLCTLRGGGSIMLLAAFLLVGWPAAVSVTALLLEQTRDVKLLGLGLFRGLMYLSIFVTAFRLGTKQSQAIRMLAVGGVSFGLVCVVGVVQYYEGIDLDLWNHIRELNPTDQTEGFGGGFMGLYRGAVGAWAAGMLSVTPLVFLARKGGWLIAALVSGALLGGLLVTGSRQGALFGAFGFGVGGVLSWLTSAQLQRRRTISDLLKMVGLVCLLGVALSWKGSNTTFHDWLSFRFNESVGEEGMILTGLKRETKAQDILEQLWERPLILLFGVGQGAIIEEVPLSGDEYELVYVDSELLWTLQQGGLVQLLVYLGFLFTLMRRSLAGVMGADAEDRRILACVLGPLVVGAAFTYGHYYLLHVQSTQAPVACWNWMVLGLGLAALEARPHHPASVTENVPGMSLEVAR